MAVNVAGTTTDRNLSLPLVEEEQSWLGRLATRARAAVRRLTVQIRAHHRYREMFDELASLDDRQLADIGVNRSEIHRIVALSALEEISARS